MSDTTSFVDEVIRTLRNKSYVPRANANASTEPPVPIPSIVGTSTSEYLPYPSHAFDTAPSNAPTGPAATRALNGKHRLPDRPTGASPGAYAQQEQGSRSRKRKQNERDTSNDRPVKQAAHRGGKSGRGGGLNAQAPAFAPMPNMPPFNPTFGEIPPFDPGNPMAFLAMAAAFGVNLPGMPPMPTFNPQNIESRNERCVDYDTKGFCAAGSACPFQHGLEYDPDHPGQGVNSREHGNRRRHNARSTGGRGRASFSLPGPTHDRTNTTLVVERIPEDNFNENDIREFFGKFGTIVDVQMHVYKRLAVIKYETHEAANQAYTDPKVIFDNRFVKVYWHKSDTDLGLSRNDYSGFGADSEEANYGDEEMLDPEEIERRQAEAQRAFEERRKKAEEAAARAEEIDRKLQETNAEVIRLRREIASKSGSSNDMDEDISQDLATLQAEADALFAQTDTLMDSMRGSDHGYRGAFRGREYTSFAPRGRGRGGYRGRGAYGAPFNGIRTGVKRLDNRPRRIAIADIEPGSRKDEALRQHLFNVPDVVSIEHHPQQANTLIVTFGERYQAESFIDTAHQIPDVGKLELAWVPNDAFGGVKTATVDAEGHDSDGEFSGTVEGDGDKGAVAEELTSGAADADMDVAEDEDQWL
ncbi:hypothetical protein N0V94_009206 [Neodidymelliopsis sp. IMI 364377]|nr:hypothetical protein N0V94_009206 [Neodidymelliopsis sp. IMI 364377]